MDHAAHARHGQKHHHPMPDHRDGLDRMAFLATLHCLAGCAVGEVAGLVIGSAIGLSNGETIVLAITLAFASGYAFTMVPFLRSGLSFGAATRLALAADTASIAIMEIVDNAVMLAIPGAMNAPLASLHFWGSLALALAIAGLAAWPVNRWLIARGRGHALAHGRH